MKSFCIGLSFVFCVLLVVGCFAEGMVAPKGALPEWIVLDRTITGICILCSLVAIRAATLAVIVVWLAVVLRLAFNWTNAPAGYLMQGVVEYAAGVAFWLTAQSLLPLLRPIRQ
jgi:hypothetical protein